MIFVVCFCPYILPSLFGQYYFDGGLEPDDCHGQSFEVPETPSGWLYGGDVDMRSTSIVCLYFGEFSEEPPENTHLRLPMYSIVIQDDR